MIYLKNEDFLDVYFPQLMDEHKVVISSTNYSRKVTINDKEKLMFTEDGKFNLVSLRLINAVRNDAYKFVKHTKPTVNENEIKWSHSFGSIEKNDMMKIDLNAAYWVKAAKMGVISKNTFLLWFELTKDYSSGKRKSERLKALGSIATVKKEETYINGKLISTVFYPRPEDKAKMLLRKLYFEICNNVSNDMYGISHKFNIPYYWDCFFVPFELVKKVHNELDQLGYYYTSEFATIECEKFDDKRYILSDYGNKKKIKTYTIYTDYSNEKTINNSVNEFHDKKQEK